MDRSAAPADRGRVVLHTRVVSRTGGGPDKTILNSPRFLREEGYDAICAYMRHPADTGFAELEERARHWRAPLVAVDDHGPADWRILRRFREVCRQHDPQIWHGHDYKSNLLGLLTRRTHPMSLVTTVHGWVHKTWKTPAYHAIDRFCLRFYDAVLCVSDDLFEACLKLGIPGDRCHLIPNAIDTQEFSRARTPAADMRNDNSSARLIIGAAGRLAGEKGFDVLIEAVHRLISQGVDLELRIAGEGTAHSALEAQATRLGVDDRVKLLGYQPDMRQFYQELDVFVVSSVREGLPNALLEAMAFELPVLSTRCGGISGVLNDGQNGLLVEPGASSGLESGLRSLAADRGLRLRLGHAARSTIEESFSFARRMKQIRKIYDHVLGAND